MGFLDKLGMTRQVRSLDFIMEGIRINKYLSENGYCSRRAADELIKKGKVFVNHAKAVLGDTVKVGDTVEVSGKEISLQTAKVYLAYNKPVGIICTADPKSPNNIIDAVNYSSVNRSEATGSRPERIFPVGRLDVASTGLIFLTNDGDFANKLTHPKFKHEKEYFVAVDKTVTEDFLKQLKKGVKLPEGTARADEATRVGDKEVSITLHQGLHRQVRRMCEELGYQVQTLKRIRIGKIELGDLPERKWRNLTEAEVKSFSS